MVTEERQLHEQLSNNPEIFFVLNIGLGAGKPEFWSCLRLESQLGDLGSLSPSQPCRGILR